MNHTFELETANADFITDFLAIGGDLAYDKEKALVQAVELVDQAGITHILDCRLEEEESLWDRFPEVEYLWDGIDDRPRAATTRWFDRITDWTVGAIEAGGTVLTHCHMGINRGPSAGYAILLRLGWDPVDALDAIRAARSIANVAFAEDALEWHLARIGASESERSVVRIRVATWREENPLDVVRVIRAQRSSVDGEVA
jgi:dual specificity phosphatase 3